jgi:hypothetical protein
LPRLKPPSPEEGRRIKTHEASGETPDRQRPTFCFEHMVDGYCVPSCNKEQKAALADALFERSRLTWGEIRQAGRTGQGYEKLARSALKRPVPPRVKPDADIIGFRFWSKARMVGYRDGTVFRVIWLDIHFDLYDHG